MEKKKFLAWFLIKKNFAVFNFKKAFSNFSPKQTPTKSGSHCRFLDARNVRTLSNYTRSQAKHARRLDSITLLNAVFATFERLNCLSYHHHNAGVDDARQLMTVVMRAYDRAENGAWFRTSQSRLVLKSVKREREPSLDLRGTG